MSSIPELKQKKIARDAAIAEASAAAAKKAEKDAAEQEKLFYANAEKYEAEYAELSNKAIANRRDAKANNQIFVVPEEKLVFVIRLRGIIGVSPKVTFLVVLTDYLYLCIYVRISYFLSFQAMICNYFLIIVVRCFYLDKIFILFTHLLFVMPTLYFSTYS